MNKYYIEHACGNFNAPIEYADKTQEEILEDILSECPEFMTLFESGSKCEAETEFSKYNNQITITRNGNRAVVDYHIYRLEASEF